MPDLEELEYAKGLDAVSSIVNPEYVQDFLLGGNCYCNIENLRTGNRFTYKIKRNSKQKNMYFVSVESGLGSIYCGYFIKDLNLYDYKKGNKGTVDGSDIRIQALLYTLQHSKRLPEYIIVEHNGYCSKCGSALTELEDLKYGLCNLCRPII